MTDQQLIDRTAKAITDSLMKNDAERLALYNRHGFNVGVMTRADVLRVVAVHLHRMAAEQKGGLFDG